MQKETKKENIELPENITASYQDLTLTINGPKGAVAKKFVDKEIGIKTEEKRISLEYRTGSKRAKTALGTMKAHINNMIAGTERGYIYKMKICSGHFPMNVSVAGNELIIKNFFGEKSPRKMKIAPDAKVKIEGQDLIVESASKESASQCAASIEKLTRRSNFDRRIFMDGIYITSKDSKELK